MNRRHFLKLSGALSAQTLFTSVAMQSLWTRSASGAQVSLDSLRRDLNPQDGKILVPTDALFAQYQFSFNQRTIQVPLVRVLCSTPQGVAVAIQWAQANNVKLAVRSGGHSYEGLSQTTGLAIDTKPMDRIALSSDAASFSAGAGSLLGNVYNVLATQKRVVPAGSCPTVGLTGHTLGGGYGLMGRPLGLACDNLISAELVNADGKILTCSETENEDLFWALRGGGAGSFGIVTKLEYKTHQVSNVLVYGMGWMASAKTIGQIMKTWQQWASKAPREINSLMRIIKGQGSLYNLRAYGQTLGSEAQLRAELANLTAVAPAALSVIPLSTTGAYQHFGGVPKPVTEWMKGKSDYLTQVMSDQALADMLDKLPAGVDVIFDSYGGAIGDVKPDATAFAHRAGVISSLQYSTSWHSPADTAGRLQMMRTFHDAMRPYMSGGAYFNYCDLDIKDYAQAYWGANLPRLMDVKAKFDPKDIFKHAQSIPLKA